MFRVATLDDVSALRDLERAANLVALAHVFPPDRYPFPDADVLARWALVLDEPGVEVLVLDDAAATGRLAAVAAFDSFQLRHLAVRPNHWGQGIATQAVQAALEAMRRRGATDATLWCLEENHRARRLYERLGWQAAPERREAPWPPYPTEMRYTRRVAEPVR